MVISCVGEVKKFRLDEGGVDVGVGVGVVSGVITGMVRVGGVHGQGEGGGAW